MNILGITGLGISPSACLVQEGKLIAMAEEERFNRFKGSFGMLPEKATKFCLDYGKLSLDSIDYIAFPWNAYKYRLYMPYYFLKTYLQNLPKTSGRAIFKTLEELLKYQPNNVINSITMMLRKAGIKGTIPPVKFIPHHLSHAANTFYCSGFDEAYILIIDGSGEDNCTTIFKGSGLDIKERKCFKMPDSLGWFYQSITEFLGFTPNRDEGKTMALAAYGKHNEGIYQNLKKMISCDTDGNYKYDASYSFMGSHSYGTVYSDKMAELLACPRHLNEPILQAHKDIAFTAQDILERIVISITKNISREPDYNKKICLAGGVCLNCKMNGIIAEQDYIEQIFVPPTSNDAGTALGAALYLSKEKGYDPRFKMEHPYWGPEFSNEEIKQTLKNAGIRFNEDKEIEKTAAKLISLDKTIGWFQGRMEIGPRALGARSILANPAKIWIKDRINKEIKNRETWRPFAPSIMYDKKNDYLPQLKESPFMALAAKAANRTKNIASAAIHTDNTTRPHFVKKEVNPKYWRLINEFKNISGMPLILNTSFNGANEPIVATPIDALKTFYATGIDYLAIGNLLVSKE